MCPLIFHITRCPRFAAVILVLTDALHASDLLPKMRILFGTILSSLMRQRINENTVWTDSQDYGADEILYTTETALFDETSQQMRELQLFT